MLRYTSVYKMIAGAHVSEGDRIGTQTRALASATAAAAGPVVPSRGRTLRMVVFASAIGTAFEPGADATVRVGSRALAAPSVEALPPPEARSAGRAFEGQLRTALTAAGYPERADPEAIRYPLLLLVLLAIVLPAAAIFGPLGAALVELFPTEVRYTAMSLPFHIGAGWFGGFMPAIAFAIVAERGDIFSGLTYVLVVAAASLVVALLFWPETRGRRLDE